MNNEQSIIKSKRAGDRIDLYLAEIFPDYSRNYFGKLIEQGKVLLNGQLTKASQKLKIEDEISIDFEKIADIADIKPENIALEIIYEDDDVLAINKPAGMVVHPAANNLKGTLVSALLAYFPEIKDAIYEKGNTLSESRPGIIHRLDKDTTGIILVAKNSRALRAIAKQIQNRTVTKIYLALIYGWPKDEKGRLTNYIGRDPKNRKIMTEIGENAGKMAISDYEVLEYLEDNAGNKISYVKFNIKTGRTHQIRTQSKLFAHPVIGDQVYNTKESKALSDKLSANRQMLHAYQFSFTLPGAKNEIALTAPIPEDFTQIKTKFAKIA